jgi:hypothetical protein
MKMQPFGTPSTSFMQESVVPNLIQPLQRPFPIQGSVQDSIPKLNPMLPNNACSGNTLQPLDIVLNQMNPLPTSH